MFIATGIQADEKVRRLDVHGLAAGIKSSRIMGWEL
jgi:hypothetical protein